MKYKNFLLKDTEVNKKYPFLFKIYDFKTQGFYFLLFSTIIPAITTLIIGIAMQFMRPEKLNNDNNFLSSSNFIFAITILNLISFVIAIIKIRIISKTLYKDSGAEIFM